MKITKTLPLSTCLLMAGCVNAFYAGKPIDPSTYNPAKDAKVRTYNTNGASILIFYRGQDCYGGEGSTDGFLATRSGWQSQKNNISLGMPVLPDTYKNFDEHVIEANKPLTIKGTYSVGGAVAGGTRTSQCTPPPMSFVPLPNKNYEIFMAFERSSCYIKVREVIGSNGTYSASQVQTTRAKTCAAPTGQ